MKKGFLTLIIQILVSVLMAKEYRSVLENTTFVQIVKTNIFSDKKKVAYEGDDPFYLGTDFSMDSLITWGKKVTMDGQEYSEYIPRYQPNYPNQYVTGYLNNIYLRESPDKTKLYSREFYQSQEYLIYDISLEVGDTFPARVSIYKNYGLAFHVYTKDSLLVVDSVYEVEGRKVVQFNYYQPFGPYGQKWAFIEGIGPNYGVCPLGGEEYLWGALIATYIRDGQTYGYSAGVLPEPMVTPFYSVIVNSKWRQFVISDESPELYNNGVDSFVYVTGSEQVNHQDFYRKQKDTLANGLFRIKLTTTYTDDFVYLMQASNCTRLYATFNDTVMAHAQLIYNISLNRGDTFHTPVYTYLGNQQWEWHDTLLVVDTTYYDEGRKIVEFDYRQKIGIKFTEQGYYQVYGPQKMQFIEGAGPNTGIIPLNPLSSYSFGFLTSVQNWNHIYIYTNSTGDIITSTQEDGFTIKMTPNPTSEVVYFEGFENFGVTWVDFYIISGKKVYTAPFNNELNIAPLAKGLYIVAIYNNHNKIIYTTKLIKK